MSIGPSRPLVLEKPAKIDIPQAARYFGARGEPDTATRTLLEKCAVPILAAATPRAVWLEADVDSLLEAGILQGGDVMKHLEGCPQALMLAVTLGPGVDAQIRRAGVGDIAASVASDALGSALAEQAGGRRRSRVAAVGRAGGKVPHGPLLAGLRRLAHHGAAESSGSAGHRRRAGICVLNTNLMTPRKSVTAILGLSDHPVKGHLAGCGHCVLRTRCEYRKRGKTCASE